MATTQAELNQQTQDGTLTAAKPKVPALRANEQTLIADSVQPGGWRWDYRVGGSGTTNKVPKFVAAYTVGDSSIEESAAGGRIGVGVAPDASYRLSVGGDVTISGVYRVSGVQIALANLSDGSDATRKSVLTVTGDIYYASGAATPARLGIGTAGQVLTVVGGVPAWATPSAAVPGGLAGSVQFNALGAFGGDETNFFWDNVNKRLGIGIAVPLHPLHVVGDVNLTGVLRISGTQIASSNLSDGVPNTRLISAGTGLSGGGDLSADRTLSIANTAVTPAQYGSAAAVGQFTVDQQGRLTQAADVAIQIAESQVTNLGTDLGLKFPYSGGTLTGAVKAPQFTDTVDALGNSGAALDINWSLGAVASITLTAVCTFTFSGAVAGQTITLILTQDATGGRTVTWPVIRWPGGAAPTLTTTPNKADIVTVFYDGVSYWGFTGGLNY